MDGGRDDPLRAAAATEERQASTPKPLGLSAKRPYLDARDGRWTV
jgi:hypothetical protein